MVNLDAIKRLIDIKSFTNLVDEKDIININNIISNNVDFFNQKRLLPGVIFVQELINKLPKERCKYGFRISQPTGVGQWQDTNGVIYDSTILNYLISEKNVIFDSDGIAEEIIFLESIPLFPESIELLCDFVSKLLKTDKVDDLSSFLLKVDGLSETYEGHDYFIRHIYINYRTNSVKLFLYKETNNTDRLKELIEYIATNKTSKFWQNANGIADCCSSRFYDESTLTGITIELTASRLSNHIGYNLQPALQNQEKYKESSSTIINDALRWEWIPEEYHKNLSEWGSCFGFKNLFIGYQIETILDQVTSRIIYGNSGFS